MEQERDTSFIKEDGRELNQYKKSERRRGMKQTVRNRWEEDMLTFHQDRAKFSGYMYGGSATLKLGENEFIFDLWHHGGDEMTLEQVKEHISLKGIKTPTKYYDLHWYAIMTEDEIWLHPEGWFNNKVLRKEPIIERRDNYNFQRDTLTDKDREHLLGLGFFRLI